MKTSIYNIIFSELLYLITLIPDITYHIFNCGIDYPNWLIFILVVISSLSGSKINNLIKE